MSRVGKVPIKIPEKVKVRLDGKTVYVEGPKGKLDYKVPETVGVEVKDGLIVVTRKDDERANMALHGMARALISNMVKGVSEGFVRELEIVGVGYKAEVKGKEIVLSLGYSHPVAYRIPEGVQVKVDKQTRISVSGFDKKLVGEVSTKIRSFRPPEPYKGKGVRYVGEIVKHKVGKATVASGA